MGTSDRSTGEWIQGRVSSLREGARKGHSVCARGFSAGVAEKWKPRRRIRYPSYGVSTGPAS
ncbi:MAG: hypothetical protein AAGF97_20620, partial [Planctomycetota bacterium]